MAPLTNLFEFAFHDSVASLEPPLGLSANDMEAFARECDSGQGYERFYLRVRGKWRTISAPAGPLDNIQRRINNLLFPVDLALGPEVNGYVARRSTLTNARDHVGASYLQKFDIQNFFDTVTTNQIASALRTAGFGTQAAQMLARLVSCEGHLPLGARTSPRISNLVLGEVDGALRELAEARNVRFSRYADDLSFSGQSGFDVSSDVRAVLVEHGYALNEEKTKSFKLGQPMFVTGLAISDPVRPRVRKRIKRRLRQVFYYVEKHGVDDHRRHMEESGKYPEPSVFGWFHYARSVEPEFADELARKFPSAFERLIPRRRTDRIESIERHRLDFVERVAAAPGLSLPFYEPTVKIGRS